MIAHIAGKVAETTETAVIIDAGGIGYEVQVPGYEREAARQGEFIKLYTHYHIRENAHELFGFSTVTAKRLFEMLISVSGVGPKMALSILNLGEVEAIRNAIALGDNAFIEKASGVGKRIAGRIAIDLKDKVGLSGVTTLTVGNGALSFTAHHDDALDALLALGYGLQQANETLDKIDKNLDAQSRIKQALKSL